MINEGSELAENAAKELLCELKIGRYKKAHRLPPETELAVDLGISRTAIRDSLSILEQEGYISRKRGVGTVVNRHVLTVRNRFDQECEFNDIVRNAGYDPSTDNISIMQENASSIVAKNLDIEFGTTVLRINRRILADGIPLLYCADYIPFSLIKNEIVSKEMIEKPIFDFLKNNCNESGAINLSGIHAVNANEMIANMLEVPLGRAVLNIQEVWYNFEGVPLLYADEYYREGMLTHTIMRNKTKW